MRQDSRRVAIPDASIRLDSMPTAGRDLDITVEREARDAIAELLEVTAVDRLQVKLHAVRFRGGIRVTGQLKALVVQPSVVSLEPVTQEIVEAVDRVFLPGGEKPYAGKADAEVFVDLEGDDLPDHFEGNEADLSDFIVEMLALSIDPYPRLEGESVGVAGDADEGDDSPFAGLKALKADGDKG
jgi:uncharacterized metal-binding protein YceD (DUF177 family)